MSSWHRSFRAGSLAFVFAAALLPASASAVIVPVTGPTITTAAQATNFLVFTANLYDTAQVTADGTTPATTGSVRFTLYGPDDDNCTGVSSFTSTKPVGADGSATSDTTTPPIGGTYRWVADYLDTDGTTVLASSPCNSPNESTLHVPFALDPCTLNPFLCNSVSSISTTAQPGPTAQSGAKLSDTAAVTAGFLTGQGPALTGSVTFRLYGPDDPSCSGTPVYTDPDEPVSVGSASSGEFTTTSDGVYRWIASYSGGIAADAAGTCGDASETTLVGKTTPTLTTSATPDASAGDPIHDTATLSNGNSPTGTITFNLYDRDDTTCTGTPLFTTTKTVNGNGAYQSDDFSGATKAGDYRWVASYGPDTNNKAVAGGCNDAGETSTLSSRPTSVSTSATASALPGSPISDTATVTDTATGNPAATGTVTFKAYGPDDGSCAKTPAFTSQPVAVGADGHASSGGFASTQAGTYTWAADYSGDDTYAAAGATCGAPGESTVVAKAVTTLTTEATGPVKSGSSFRDTATLTGGSSPTGTITFHVYGPGDTSCANQLGSSTVTVSGNGDYESGAFVFRPVGDYRWKASYDGDTVNGSAGGSCTDSKETSTVTRATPTLSTQASGPVAVGNAIHDTATLVGASAPTGTVTFRAYGPDAADCAGTPAFTSSPAVSSSGDTTSQDFTPTASGAYLWTASYDGDANNEGASSGCKAAGETSTATKRSPSLTTLASGPATLGEPVHDSASLAGAFNPTGTVTFNAYGPDHSDCTGTPAFTSAKAVGANGEATSDDFTPAGSGTYRWTASYGGDTNNEAASSGCDDQGETSAVSKHSPALSTNASAGVALGGSVTDSAKLTGGSNPTGTVTFAAYGPDDANCSGAPAFTGSGTVDSGGQAASGQFTPAAPGVYRWVASYGGDTANATVSGACGDPDESVTVAKAASTTALASSANPSTIGDPVTLTAAVAVPAGLGPATGHVTFKDGGATIGTAALAGGAAELVASGLPTGQHPITALYEGDGKFEGSTSPELVQTVTQGDVVPGPGEADPPRLVISHIQTRVDGRTAPLFLRCMGAAGQRCRGSIRLRPTGALNRADVHVAALRGKSFNVAAGARHRVRAPLATATSARLDRTGKAVVAAIATLRGPDRVTWRALTLFR